jgi:hypothetical protein
MPTDGSLARWRSRRGLRIAALLAGVSLSAVSAHAQDATWNLNGTGDFNTSANWSPDRDSDLRSVQPKQCDVLGHHQQHQQLDI